MMLSKSVSKVFYRSLHAHKAEANKLKLILEKKLEKGHDPFEKFVERHREKLVYSSVISKRAPGYYTKKRFEKEEGKLQEFIKNVEPLPLFLKYLETPQKQNVAKAVNVEPPELCEAQVTHFPLGHESTTSVREVEALNGVDVVQTSAEAADEEVRKRFESYNEVRHNWMKDYENYEEADEVSPVDTWKINYGTPDPTSEISSVPCGGCGALLHCKDTSIPGYIPSEIYKNSFKSEGVDLKGIICQRCHFLKNYNLALQLRVSSEDYPKVLETLSSKRVLVVLMVDLLDFPCSIWPDIADILGYNKPIVIVGNKVDLLPRDCAGYLENIKSALKQSFTEHLSGKTSVNIKHIALISAKTGFGIEELINKLHNIWATRGDVYLVGCTNVGKSTLFNSLLQSDYCKIKAVDLIQRATTSQWPGTTLNLLKFPILRPSGFRLYARTKRLQSLARLRSQEHRLNKSDPQSSYTSLLDMVDRTFKPEPTYEDANLNTSTKATAIGIDEKDPDFVHSKWCYDTPGVVQPDQIVHLLTTEELMLTLPKQLIKPQTFSMRPNQTIFIAGLGRLDYLDGPSQLLMTVFCSEELPLTVCATQDADSLYKELLGSELFQVPKGTEERLSKWPNLKPSMTLTMAAAQYAPKVSDVVLSSAGWISVKVDKDSEVKLQAWTPEARGIYIRTPMLPFIFNYRGTKLRKSPAYTNDKVFRPK